MLALVVCMTSCEKDEDKEVITKYSIVDRTSGKESAASYGMQYECSAYISECNDKDEIVENKSVNLSSIPTTKVANEMAVKLKVQINTTLTYKGESKTNKKWVQQVYYLKKGGTIEIVIDDETIVGSSRP